MTIGIDPTVRQIRTAIQRLEQRVGLTGTVTLAPGETSTVVSHSQVGMTTTVVLTPASASAAAASGVFVEVVRGSFTIHHDVAPGVSDRTFRYAILT